MTLLRTVMDLPDATLERVTTALRLGLYQVAPLHDGVAERDLHHRTHRLVCDVTRAPDGSPLPYIEMRAGTRRWTDPETVRPHGDRLDRIAAYAEIHRRTAIAVLKAPTIADGALAALRDTLAAVAATCDRPIDGSWVVVAEAPTPWSTCRVGRVPGRFGPSPQQPDPEIAMLLPLIASVQHTLRGRDGGRMIHDRNSILIDTVQVGVHTQDAPDPVTTMRTLARLKADGGVVGARAGDLA